MKTRIGFATLLCLTLTVAGNGQDKSYDGYWWIDFTQNYKLGFIAGYSTAMTHTYDRANIDVLGL